MITWKSEYETGISFIDQQHKRLFNIGNEAYQLLKNDFCVDKYDKIVEIINELKDYTKFHFKAEEEYIIKNKLKGFFEHKVQHDDFIKKLENIDYGQIDNGQNDYLLQILDFILNWIKEHILVCDMKYAERFTKVVAANQ